MCESLNDPSPVLSTVLSSIGRDNDSLIGSNMAPMFPAFRSEWFSGVSELVEACREALDPCQVQVPACDPALCLLLVLPLSSKNLKNLREF